MKFAIVVSRFNETITEGLLEGALKFFSEVRHPVSSQDVFYGPGAFELPLIAKALAKKKKYQGVVCLGCVIKGDTMHFEYISLGATIGLQEATLQTGKPITFGILTTLTEEQAFHRSRPNSENKGREAAAACYETAVLLKKISK
jgi:6,7-dimethyl-8-ribityllumazine synthase